MSGNPTPFYQKHTQTFLTETDSRCMCRNMHKNSGNTDTRCTTGNPEEIGMLLYYDGRTPMIRRLHQSRRSVSGGHQSQLPLVLNYIMNLDKPLPIFHPKGIISVMIEG